jgi:sulfur-oxidizing protein SoxA
VIRLYKNTLLFCGLLLTFPATAVLAGEVKSGYDYIKPESRAMQDDDFENPGMLAVEKGQVLFNQKQNGTDKACAECHGEGGENLNTKNIARYPVYSEDAAEIVTLQKRISRCRDNTSGSKPLPTDHADLVNLETFVRHRAIGEAVNVQTDGAIAELLQAGEQLYNTRYGLIDMACYHCHDLYPGQMIRGQKISQGQGNGFPAYRLGTGEITNLHQRIQQCLTLMRAEPFAADSDEINLLGLYIMSRSNGLRIETPAVRY